MPELPLEAWRLLAIVALALSLALTAALFVQRRQPPPAGPGEPPIPRSSRDDVGP